MHFSFSLTEWLWQECRWEKRHVYIPLISNQCIDFRTAGCAIDAWEMCWSRFQRAFQQNTELHPLLSSRRQCLVSQEEQFAVHQNSPAYLSTGAKIRGRVKADMTPSSDHLHTVQNGENTRTQTKESLKYRKINNLTVRKKRFYKGKIWTKVHTAPWSFSCSQITAYQFIIKAFYQLEVEKT